MVASSVLKILSLLGMLLLFTMFTGPLLQALGRPHHLAILEWTRTLVGSGLLIGAGIWVDIARCSGKSMESLWRAWRPGLFLVLPVFLYLLLHLGKISTRELISSITPSVLASIAVVASVLSLYPPRILPETRVSIQLMIEVAVGGSLVYPPSDCFDRQLRGALLGLVQRRLGAVAI